MTSKQLSTKLLLLLESCEGTAEFLEGLQHALEGLYAEAESACPAGFAALDVAIEAFRADDEANS